MYTINFYSEKKGEIKKFLESYYSKNLNINNNLSFKKSFASPIEMIDIISCFIDNSDKFEISLWISLDKDIFIRLNNSNINTIIKYIYERYPY